MTSGGEKPHVTITVDWDILKGQIERLPEIDGTPVTPETLRRITCDAGIIPMVLGTRVNRLMWGERHAPSPPRYAEPSNNEMVAVYGQGCNAPVSWCDAHHIIHWADAGETNLTNTQLLCRTHHTATHKQERSPPDY